MYDNMTSVESVDAFLSSGIVSRSMLLGDEKIDVSSFVGDFASPKQDEAGCCGAVDVWRKVYESWCAKHDVEPASPAAFGRGVRAHFGLKSVPYGKRADIDGRKVQYRVFVDGPYASGHQGSGRPRKNFAQDAISDTYVAVTPKPIEGGLFANTMSHFDVESYLARKSQLEAYISCGYVSSSHEQVSYDGWSGADSCDLTSKDVPFLQSFSDIFGQMNLTGGAENLMRVSRKAQCISGMSWDVVDLPDGEYLVEFSLKLPVPDGFGSQSDAWCRLVAHLRKEGVAHYGSSINSKLKDHFDVSEGETFSDDCLIGINLSIFEGADGFSGGTFAREFTFDIPSEAFNYFGFMKITSGFVLCALGDQYEVEELMYDCDALDGESTTRALNDDEPDFPVVYAPEMKKLRGGAVDYICGRSVSGLGTVSVVKQLDAKSMFSAVPRPVKLPD